jgi:hypothetical protein
MSGTRPLSDAPTWATDETFASGSQTGETTRLEPSAGVKAQGIIPDRTAAARRHNWLLGSICDYLQYLSAMPLVNWQSSMHPALNPLNGNGILCATDKQHMFVTGLISAGESKVWRNSVAKFTSGTLDRSIYDAIDGAVAVPGDGGDALKTGILGALDLNVNGWLDVTPTGLGTGGGATTHHSMCFTEAINPGVLLFTGSGSTIGNNIRRSINYGDTWSTVACHAGADGYRDTAYDGANFYATPVADGSFKVGKSLVGASWAATTGALSGAFWATAINLRIRAGAVGNLIVFSHNEDADHRTVNYTTDAGVTWTDSGSVDSVAALGITDIAYSPVSEDWYALMKEGEVNRSTDNGATWASMGNTGLDTAMALKIDGGALVAFGMMSGGVASVSYSVDEGATWNLIRLGQAGDPYPDIDKYVFTSYSGAFYMLAKPAGDPARLYYSQRTRP